MGKSRTPTVEQLIDRLRSELGAEVAISMRDTPTVSKGQQRKVNSQLVSAFRNAIPYTLVDEALVTVVWPSVPADKDMALLRRRLIAACGIWEARTNHLWLVPEERDRAVTPDEIAAYLPWFMNGLEATGCKYTLLVGSRSVWAWRPDIKPVRVNGRLYIWRDTWLVYPIPHPMNVTKREAQEWDDMLTRLGNIIREDELVRQLGEHCMKCGSPVHMYDPDGVPWCRDHIQEGLRLHKEATKKWGMLTINATNGVLFPPGES